MGDLESFVLLVKLHLTLQFSFNSEVILVKRTLQLLSAIRVFSACVELISMFIFQPTRYEPLSVLRFPLISSSSAVVHFLLLNFNSFQCFSSIFPESSLMDMESHFSVYTYFFHLFFTTSYSYSENSLYDMKMFLYSFTN